MRHILNWFRLRNLEKEFDRELSYHVDRRVANSSDPVSQKRKLAGRLLSTLAA